MPLYEYRCPICGTTREVRHGMDEDVEILCIHRGNIMWPMPYDVLMEKVISAPNLVFKGSGFYETDYKRKQ